MAGMNRKPGGQPIINCPQNLSQKGISRALKHTYFKLIILQMRRLRPKKRSACINHLAYLTTVKKKKKGAGYIGLFNFDIRWIDIQHD